MVAAHQDSTETDYMSKQYSFGYLRSLYRLQVPPIYATIPIHSILRDGPFWIHIFCLVLIFNEYKIYLMELYGLSTFMYSMLPWSTISHFTGVYWNMR